MFFWMTFFSNSTIVKLYSQNCFSSLSKTCQRVGHQFFCKLQSRRVYSHPKAVVYTFIKVSSIVFQQRKQKHHILCISPSSEGIIIRQNDIKRVMGIIVHNRWYSLSETTVSFEIVFKSIKKILIFIVNTEF